MNNAQKYLASLSPEARKAILSRGGKNVKHRKGLFRDGESRAQDAGRKGGISTALSRAATKAIAGKPAPATLIEQSDSEKT